MNDKPNRIAWISRHAPTRSQREELERWFPGHVLIIDPKPFDGADEIVERLKDFDDAVIVAPFAVLRALTDRGIEPIYAEMRGVKPNDPQVDVHIKGRAYHFVRFQRITGVDLKFRPLEFNRPALHANQTLTNRKEK